MTAATARATIPVVLVAQTALGDKVETSYVESVPEGPDAERAIERLARSGCNIIFTTSFGFMDPTIKVAAKFPDVKFEHATGFKTAPNVATYNSRFYEGRYIHGPDRGQDVEGRPRRLHRLVPDPRGRDGHRCLHARRSVSQSRLQGQDRLGRIPGSIPAKEADAAKALFDQGADIITQHTDSPAPLQVAEERGSARLRPGARHDLVRAQGPVHGDRRHLGPYYTQRLQAGPRRHLEVRAELGRPEGRHHGDGALYQPA